MQLPKIWGNFKRRQGAQPLPRMPTGESSREAPPVATSLRGSYPEVRIPADSHQIRTTLEVSRGSKTSADDLLSCDLQ